MSARLPKIIDEFRVGERPRLANEVTHVLREMILAHKIPTGTHLLQTELAERLGVSRTPLREAIRLLERDGLVRVTNGNRTVEVVGFTSRELQDWYQIREVIDGLAARLLAGRGLSDEATHELSGHLEVMANSVAPLHGEQFFIAHSGFHAGILLHCGNGRLRSELPLVRTTAASLRDEFPRRLRASPRGAPKQDERIAVRAVREHEAIYEAICEGDEERAELVARVHIRNAVDLIPPDSTEPARDAL